MVVGLAVVYRALASGLLASIPAVAVSRVLGGHPLGDAVLWEPGGVWLLEVVRRAPSHAPYGAYPLAAAVFVSLFAASLPLALIVASYGSDAPLTWTRASEVALGVAPRFTLLAALVITAQTLSFAFTTALVGFASRPFVSVSDERWPFVVGAALGLGFAFGIGILGDLVRASVVWRNEGVWASLVWAQRQARQGYRALFVAAAGRALLGAFGLTVCAKLVLALLPERPVAAAFVSVGCGSIPVALRSSWFGAVARELGAKAVVASLDCEQPD